MCNPTAKSIPPTRATGWRAGCALLLVSSFAAAGIAEIGARLLGHRSLTVNPEQRLFWSYHPTLGWHHPPRRHGVFAHGGVRVTVRINRQGLRDREYPFARVSGRKRILVLGDSFAWGFGVEQDEIFSEQLESTLADVEVINAGVSGYSTDQELLWLEAEGRRYRPDLVILTLSGNDDALNRRSVAYFVYPKPFFVLAPGGALELRNVPVPGASLPRRLAFHGSRRSAILKLIVDRSARLARRTRSAAAHGADEAGPDQRPEEPFALTTALLERIQRVTDEAGARLLLLTTGTYWPADSPGTYGDLLDTLRQRGFAILDVEACTGFAPDLMRLPDDGHWNARGHAFVAARLSELIERRGWLDPRQPQSAAEY